MDFRLREIPTLTRRLVREGHKLGLELGLALIPFMERPGGQIRRSRAHDLELAFLFCAMTVMTVWFWIRRDTIFWFGEDGTLGDPMLVSGYIVALTAIWLSFWIDGLYLRAVRRMKADDTLSIGSWQLFELHRHIRRLCFVWRWRLAILVLAAEAIGFTVRFGGFPDGAFEREFFVSACLLGGIAGHRLGSIVAYGHLPTILVSRKAEFHLTPAHPDGAGGVLSLGRFLTVQGVLALIPVLWLTFWCFSFEDYPEYSGWSYLFYVLLVIATVSLYVGALRPAYQLAMRFRRARNALRDAFEAQIADVVTRTRETLRTTTDLATYSEAAEQMKRTIELRDSINRLPVFPMGSGGASVMSATSILPVLTWAIGLFLPDGSTMAKLIENSVSQLLGLF